MRNDVADRGSGMMVRRVCLSLIATGLAGTVVFSAAAEGIELRLAQELGFRYSFLRHQVLAAASPGPATATDAARESTPRPMAEASLRFDILRYEVEGNTLFKPEQVQALVTPFTGKDRDFGDIQRAVEALEQAYRTAGYSAVQVHLPEQELERGVVTLKVIEARIGKIDIGGNKYFDSDNIRRSLPTLREGISPNARAISAAVVAANDNPAKKLNVTLQSGEEEGKVNAKVDVTDENPRKFFLTFDNTGNPQTGSYRLGLGFQHANIANRDHAVTLQYITSPEKLDKVSIYSVAYRMPVYAFGDSMDFFAAYSDVDAGTTSTPAGPLQFTGKGKILGARYNWILPRQGGFEQRLIFALDYRAYENSCSIGGAALCGTGGADVTVHPLGVTYSGQLNRATSQTAFSAGLARNFAGAQNGGTGDFERARPSARPDYTVLRLNLNHVTVHGKDWQSRIAVGAQHSSDALVPGEQFGLVGSNAVRGFLEREIANDTGYFANLELYSPDFGSQLASKLGGKFANSNINARALVFYDFGHVSRNNVLPAEVEGASASSIGAGLRLNIRKDIALRVDAAQVIAQGTTPRGNSVRVHAGLVLSY